ncbi:hypothetical protein CC78DRAFT_574409 [Lojkania enalia]|uniref:Uncharacterized protein n=1 Tax=Lojkania enalia TaxID=147567 RepID=A0A9P4NBQ8_9PLEO|nr:hypothetical protein CC78DRAFT_574409 [Didymosphaeria enalia]
MGRHAAESGPILDLLLPPLRCSSLNTVVAITPIGRGGSAFRLARRFDTVPSPEYQTMQFAKLSAWHAFASCSMLGTSIAQALQPHRLTCTPVRPHLAGKPSAVMLRFLLDVDPSGFASDNAFCSRGRAWIKITTALRADDDGRLIAAMCNDGSDASHQASGSRQRARSMRSREAPVSSGQ